MATPIQELVDKRVKLIEDARAFVAECEKDHGELTADESARFDKMHDDADELKASIDAKLEAEKLAAARAERQERAERELAGIQDAARADAVRNGLGRQLDTGKPIDRQQAIDNVLQDFVLNGRAGAQQNPDFAQNMQASGCRWDSAEGGLYIPLANKAPQNLWQLKNAQSTTATEGGHTTAPGFVASLEQAMLEFGGMRQAATIIRTDSGTALDWPTVDDTSNTGALLSENVQDAEQDVTFGNLTLDAYKYTSRIVRVSVEIAQDSAFNLGSVLGALLGERLGRIQNTHMTTGTGTSQPNGIVTASTLGKTAASASAITMDELLDLEASVDPAYRPRASWMFNDSVRNYIRKLKSTDSVYHWQPGAQAGDPDRLFQYPFTVNQDMASITNSAKTVLFGAIDKYLIREVMGITVIALRERYADYHQTGYVAIMRTDGDLLDAGTNPVKHLAQAA